MKKYLVLVLIALLIGALMVGCSSVAPEIDLSKKPSGPAGGSNTAHLYLYEKNPVTWSIVDGGAWGKMKYNLSGSNFDFVFNGHGLDAGVAYTLIYYPDKIGNPWPRLDIICLGSGIANGGGEVNIAGSVPTGTLPNPADEINGGAKIWLILSNDELYCGENTAQMKGWNPTEYLFEGELITFTQK